MAASYTGQLCDAAAHLERAAALMVHAPADVESFSEQLQAAAGELRRVSHAPPAEIAVFRARLNGLNTLFHRADTFYRGWAALAGVSSSDRTPPSISIQA